MSLGLKDPSLFREQAYINGAWVDGQGVIDVINPATQEVIGTVPNLGAAETKQAIDAANAAWQGWRGLTAGQRRDVLFRWSALIRDNTDDLCRVLTIEQGKPLAESRGEIVRNSDYLEWMAEEGCRVYGDIIPAHDSAQRFLVLKQPVGVTAAITPWNFPSSMITRKAGAALAAGCPVVLKPSELTPYSALALAELAGRAGIPKGVFNVVTGDAAPIGTEMCNNPVVRKLGFTGSTRVGKLLYEQGAKTVKKISLELGGNTPFIVFDDANIEVAVKAAVADKFRNAGQTCVTTNRFFVQDGLYDIFVEQFTEQVKKLNVGNGLEQGVDLGPMINVQGVEKVELQISDALSKGAELKTGGGRHALGCTFFEPTVLVDVTPDMLFFREETFGPMAAILKFKSEEEVIRLANDTNYGLASKFYSNDLARVFRVVEALEYGMVSVNGGMIGTAMAPFGGIKESGIGIENSKYGIDEFLETKLLALGGI